MGGVGMHVCTGCESVAPIFAFGGKSFNLESLLCGAQSANAGREKSAVRDAGAGSVLFDRSLFLARRLRGVGSWESLGISIARERGQPAVLRLARLFGADSAPAAALARAA